MILHTHLRASDQHMQVHPENTSQKTFKWMQISQSQNPLLTTLDSPHQDSLRGPSHYQWTLQPINLAVMSALDRQLRCQHIRYTPINLHCCIFVITLLWSSDICNCLHAASFHHTPGQIRGTTMDNGPGESGLGWGLHTNTQLNVLKDPMPSYFRTSVRWQGAARRDRQTAVLKDLEQGGWRWRGG